MLFRSAEREPIEVFRTATRDQTLPDYTADAALIRRTEKLKFVRWAFTEGR